MMRLGLDEKGDLFGSTLAIGDFNSDGLDDVIVGAPGESPGSDPQSGYTFVFNGSNRGLVASQGLDQSMLGINEKGDLFGSSLAVGDFNGDGFDDLIVGAPGESPGSDPQSGYTFVFNGSNRGLIASQGLDQASLGINEKGDLFGSALAVGDFNGDGFDDVIVGAPGESPGADPQSGYAFVFNGSNRGLIASQGLDQASLGINEKGDLFGSALAVGDFNGDGFDDVIVGAPGESPGADPQSGYAFVFNGSNRGLIASQGLDQASLGINEKGDLFGSALAVGDFNGDGFDDVIVGAPGESPGANPQSGYAFVFNGSNRGLIASQGLDQASLGINEKGDLFGSALAVGDFNGDGFDDIGIGAPGESPGSDPQSGYAFIFKGSSNGLVTSQGLEQDSTFDIDLHFVDNNLTDEQQALFTAAVDRWTDIIIGDLPDAFHPEYGLIDDLLIEVSAVPIDGSGNTLAQANTTDLRSDSLLPYTGFIQIDTADRTNIQLENIILHEIGHVLGIGGLWDNFNLVSGAGTNNPQFLGTSATHEYNNIFGLNASSVPVENSGLPGTRDVHWRESIFGNELMTGFIDLGNLPLSRISVASLSDIGYEVNLDKADSFSPSTLVSNVIGSSNRDTLNGNRLNNLIKGFEESDSLLGKSGNDTIEGGFGHDTIRGNQGNDRLWGGSGQDKILGGTGDDFINGQTGDDTLKGGKGNDTLIGIKGNDVLEGGAGSDRYDINSKSDRIIERKGQGEDWVYSSISISLGANLENLYLKNSAAHGTGNSLDNKLRGNKRNNKLVGAGGSDILYGLEGRDQLVGGTSNDLLIGGLGADSITGGLGADRFRFYSTLEKGDSIRDFSHKAGDTIEIIAQGFGAGLNYSGSLRDSQFILGSRAKDTSDRFIYNSSNGRLFFDADGTGNTAKIHLATLSNNAKLQSDDLVIFA